MIGHVFDNAEWDPLPGEYGKDHLARIVSALSFDLVVAFGLDNVIDAAAKGHPAALCTITKADAQVLFEPLFCLEDLAGE